MVPCGTATFHDDEVNFIVLENGLLIVSIGRGSKELMRASIGVERTAHRIEFSKVKSENLHVTSLLRVWVEECGGGCVRNTWSRVRVARFYSNGSHLKHWDLHGFFRTLESRLSPTLEAESQSKR